MSTPIPDPESQQRHGPSPVEEEPPLRRRISRHVRLDLSPSGINPEDRPWGVGSSIYYRSRPQSQTSFELPYQSMDAGSRGRMTPTGGVSPYPSMRSVSTLRLHALLEELEAEQFDTFGVEELRDGFFDATFHVPKKRRLSRIQSGRSSRAHSISGSSGQATPGLPSEETTYAKQSKLEFADWWRTQKEDIGWFLEQSAKTRKGVVVGKAAVAYWVAYVLCLVPVVRHWLGRYPYFAPVAVLMNHPGRTVGAQIEGTVECVLGPMLGIAMGVVAQELSHSTSTALKGKGGVMTAIMAVFLFLMAWTRCYFLRLHQTTLSSVMTFLYICLELTTEEDVGYWRTRKLRDFCVPWAIGLAIAQVVNLLISPSAGSRYISHAIHSAIEAAKKCMVLPREPSAHLFRQMTLQLVNLSEAVRDMRLELTIFSLRSTEVEELRNLLQALIRDLMGLDPATALFDPEQVINPLVFRTVLDPPEEAAAESQADDSDSDEASDVTSSVNAANLVKKHMSVPARNLIDCMSDILCVCDTELMSLANQPSFATSPTHGCGTVEDCIGHLKEAMTTFDAADKSLFAEPSFPKSLSSHPEIVELFLFIHPLRKASNSFLAFSLKVSELKSSPDAGKRHILLPRFDTKRAFLRANKQVRHDRGGMNVGRFFHMKNELNARIEEHAARRFQPTPRQDETGAYMEESGEPGEKRMGVQIAADPNTVRFKLWSLLHRLQGFESRFAFKVTVLLLLLALPAWLSTSTGWWNENEVWWVAIVAWLMMHPRVGGNFRDLLTRTVSAIFGALWGALAFFSRDGNPYVMAAFAAIFAFPAIFRYIASSHPRSGLISSLAFTIVSLSVSLNTSTQTAFHVAWTRSASIIVGVVTAVVVNWIFWPFVARHELRKSIASMILQLGIYYRIIIAKYIYHDWNVFPNEEDVRKSEVTEAYIREGIIRLQSILDMTQHEIRIRGPFPEQPFSQLLRCLERFFERLVQVRQSSLYFQSYMSKDTEEVNKRLISVRRDAVASILMNTYLLSGALRTGRPVPKYLPSVSAARKRLLDKMEELEMDEVWEAQVTAELEHGEQGEYRPWASVYQYAFSAALTDIVECLEEVQVLAKEILGEMALDVGESYRRYGRD